MDVNMVEAVPNRQDIAVDYCEEESEDLTRTTSCFTPNFVYYTQKILVRLQFQEPQQSLISSNTMM